MQLSTRLTHRNVESPHAEDDDDVQFIKMIDTAKMEEQKINDEYLY